MNTGSLDPGRTVHRVTKNGRVAHLSVHCPRLKNSRRARPVEAGSLWDDTRVCAKCAARWG